ncbi:MAG: hypothetical protein AAB426_06735 [Myxococcota bacterium]
MFTLELPALAGLVARSQLALGPYSRLSWFAEQAVTDDAVADALARLHARGYADDNGNLIPGLAASLEILADPVLRVQVTRAAVGGPARTVGFDSDGVVAVTAITDGRELVVSPTLTFDEVASGIVDLLYDDASRRDGAKIDLVGLEAGFLALIAPVVLGGGTTGKELHAALVALGATLNEQQVSEALEALCTRGWLARTGDSYGVDAAAQPRWAPLVPEVVIDIVTTHFGIEREMAHTDRFHRRDTHVWRIEPFVAGHDTMPAAHASEDVAINTFFGLSYVPQSREMVGHYVADRLGVAKPRATQPTGGAVRRRR